MSRCKQSKICARRTVTTALLSLLSTTLGRHPCMAFMQVKQNGIFTIHATNRFIRIASTNNNDSSDFGLSDDDGLDEERELARQFNEQLRRRAASSFSDSSTKNYEISSNALKPRPIRKFTGASAPLFTKRDTNPDNENANLQRERQREFNLASRFERTFPIQAVILLASAIFISVVGLSGGITDGSERYFYGDDDLIEDAVVEQLERIRTDDAAEVSGSFWL
jgi:hypothetical protein